MDPRRPATPQRTSFLLAQVGALASKRFAEHTRALGLTPGDAGVLRLLGRSPATSQRELADRLGTVPSRIVSLVDSLESRGLVERTRSNTDRRNYELRLTPSGQEHLVRLRRVAEEHETGTAGVPDPGGGCPAAQPSSGPRRSPHPRPGPAPGHRPVGPRTPPDADRTRSPSGARGAAPAPWRGRPPQITPSRSTTSGSCQGGATAAIRPLSKSFRPPLSAKSQASDWPDFGL